MKKILHLFLLPQLLLLLITISFIFPSINGSFSCVGGLDENTYLKAAHFAQQAYSYIERDSICEELIDGTHNYFIRGKTGFPSFPNEHTIAGVNFPNENDDGEKKTIYVAYHGSSYLDDWFSDLDCMSIYSPFGLIPGKVHKGFYQAASSSFQAFTDCLTRNVNVNELHKTEFVFTGHSLGGALAAMAFLNLHQEFSIVFPGNILQDHQIKLITFSSPKVGDAVFAFNFDRILKDNTLRFLCKADTVPTLPFWFEQIGRPIEVYFSDNAFNQINKTIYTLRPKNIHTSWRAISWINRNIIGAFKRTPIGHAIEFGGQAIIVAHTVPGDKTLVQSYSYFILQLASADDPDDADRAGTPKYWSPRNPLRRAIGF